MQIKHFDEDNAEWDKYSTSQSEILNDIIDFADIDDHKKPIQCIYNEEQNRIDVLYMVNEDDRHINWGWKYLIYQVDTKDWMQLLMQYANKRINKPVISFVYKEVDKIP